VLRRVGACISVNVDNVIVVESMSSLNSAVMLYSVRPASPIGRCCRADGRGVVSVLFGLSSSPHPAMPMASTQTDTAIAILIVR
jgi:hypothetical protein